MNKLIGRKCKIISDNENYEEYRDKVLIITHTSYSTNDHPGYDEGMYPDALCDLQVSKTGKPVPFSLYEFEFKLLK